MIFRFILTLCCVWGFSYAGMFQSVNKEQATLVQKGDAKLYCPNCGMNLVMFYKTSHAHENHQYCSLHCLFESTKGTIPRDAKVVDTKTLAFIDAQKAFYVVGSKVPGTMSMNSKYAFSNEMDAKAFIAENGGEMMSFQDAYKKAGEDFQKDSAMIHQKRENGMYGMGEKLYNASCAKVEPTQFNTIGDLKASLKKSCKLEEEKQYQAVVLYLWDKKRMEPSNSPKLTKKIDVPKDAKCPVCGMFVAKHPQWVALIEENGKSVYFDGVKDMMKYIFAQKKSFENIFVTDYYKIKKLNAKKAFYVVGSNVYGPMGTELIPFASEKEAQTFAHDHNGKKVFIFDEIDSTLIQSL